MTERWFTVGPQSTTLALFTRYEDSEIISKYVSSVIRGKPKCHRTPFLNSGSTPSCVMIKSLPFMCKSLIIMPYMCTYVMLAVLLGIKTAVRPAVDSIKGSIAIACCRAPFKCIVSNIMRIRNSYFCII